MVLFLIKLCLIIELVRGLLKVMGFSAKNDVTRPIWQCSMLPERRQYCAGPFIPGSQGDIIQLLTSMR